MVNIQDQLQNVNVLSSDLLATPEEIKRRLPLTQKAANTVFKSRQVVRSILERGDPRLFVIVGPCSIHDVVAARDYANRLKELSARIDSTIFPIMRVYFEKPRTTVGWKGLINDPDLDDSFHIEKGILLARELLLYIAELGLPAGTEALDPIMPQYMSELITWTAIGARTTESQTHREMASGLSMPVGFKNTTEGNLQAAINAIQSSRRSHSFLGITQEGMSAVIRTSGNPDTHIVLRGGRDPNYDAHSIQECRRMLASAGLEARVIVDCSHAQTGKDYTKQAGVLRALVDQVCTGSRAIMGAMLESNIEAGSQPVSPNRANLKYGVSVTDPCIDWPTTEQCLLEAAAALASARAISA